MCWCCCCEDRDWYIAKKFLDRRQVLEFSSKFFTLKNALLLKIWFGQPKYSTATKNPSTLWRLLLLFSSFHTWSRLDHYWSNVHQRDHRSGCLLKRFIVYYYTQYFFFFLCKSRDQSMPGSFPTRLLFGGESPWERGWKRWLSYYRRLKLLLRKIKIFNCYGDDQSRK